MNNSKFLLALIVVVVAMMAISGLQYGVLLKDFYRNNAGVSDEQYSMMFREMDEANVPAGIASAVAAGLLLTTVLVWGGFTSAAAGARAGAIICPLVGIIVDFGMMSFMKAGTLTAGLVNIPINIVIGLIIGGLGGMVLSKGRTTATA